MGSNNVFPLWERLAEVSRKKAQRSILSANVGCMELLAINEIPGNLGFSATRAVTLEKRVKSRSLRLNV